MPKIGNYSHRQLVAIICKLIGKAHGTDGCFEYVRTAAELDAVLDERPDDASPLIPPIKAEEAGGGDQVVTNKVTHENDLGHEHVGTVALATGDDESSTPDPGNPADWTGDGDGLGAGTWEGAGDYAVMAIQ